jgi:hypothetical protein
MNWKLAPRVSSVWPTPAIRNVCCAGSFRRSGKLTSNLMEAVAHVRSAPGLAAPDFQLIHAPIYARLDEINYPQPALSILQSYWTPASRGSVLVSSPDARDAPAIQLNHADGGGRRGRLRAGDPTYQRDRLDGTVGVGDGSCDPTRA